MANAKVGRFDYVRYDKESATLQAQFKELFRILEGTITHELPGGTESQKLALQHLEYSYMWVGKSIRDAQAARGGAIGEEPARGEWVEPPSTPGTY